jgi:hypothetical protein
MLKFAQNEHFKLICQCFPTLFNMWTVQYMLSAKSYLTLPTVFSQTLELARKQEFDFSVIYYINKLVEVVD